MQLFDFFSCKLGPFSSKKSPPDWWDAKAQALLRWESSHLDPGCRAGGATVSAAAHLPSYRISEDAGRLGRWQDDSDLLLLAAARTAMAEPSAWPTNMQCLILYPLHKDWAIPAEYPGAYGVPSLRSSGVCLTEGRDVCMPHHPLKHRIATWASRLFYYSAAFTALKWKPDHVRDLTSPAPGRSKLRTGHPTSSARQSMINLKEKTPPSNGCRSTIPHPGKRTSCIVTTVAHSS
jgi:hypothetical protein